MSTARLAAFTDGVIAIIITIMVLDIRVPQGRDLAALQADVPVLLAYLLSYVNVGIFWNNHHHMLHVTERVNGRVLWANLALLFWLSLIPFVIRWIDDAGFAPLPTAAYGVVLACAAVSYVVLQQQIIALNGRQSRLAVALGDDLKGKLSLVCYLAAVVLAFIRPWIAIALYVTVALIWLAPDRRIESLVGKQERAP
ncbi:MAG TPA: TMEM175 family protein [Steroidobacteraceae bacterium]|nr:TMEM175 family protein [Steroidobacteraceae bacterium]